MKKILKWSVIIAVFSIIIGTILGIYRETKIKKGKASQELVNIVEIERQSTNINQQENNHTKNPLYVVPQTYKGYKVAAKLKIGKLKIDTCVLDEYTKAAMETCVTKFYGPEPNEIGNFCITGHNYITKNMFGYLYKLEIGDTFTLTDNKNGKVEYKIYDKYRAEPNQTYRAITKNKWRKGSYTSYML